MKKSKFKIVCFHLRAVDKDCKGLKTKSVAQQHLFIKILQTTQSPSRVMLKKLSVMMPLGLKIKLALKRLFRLIVHITLIIRNKKHKNRVVSLMV